MHSKDRGEVVQSVLGVLEVERESKDDVEGRVGVVVTAGVEVAWFASDVLATVGSSWRHTARSERTLHPRPHQLGVNACSVVQHQVRTAHHVLEVAARRLQAKVREHPCIISTAFTHYGIKPAFPRTPKPGKMDILPV